MNFQNIRLIGIVAFVGILLLIPLTAMQFTGSPNWSKFDFAVAAVLLLGTGLALEAAMRRVRSLRNRLIVGAAIIFVLFLVWAELAVGLFGTPLAGS